jgi:hypothetical protein
MEFHKDERGRYLPLLPRADPRAPRAKPEFRVGNPPPGEKGEKSREKENKEEEEKGEVKSLVRRSVKEEDVPEKAENTRISRKKGRIYGTRVFFLSVLSVPPFLCMNLFDQSCPKS